VGTGLHEVVSDDPRIPGLVVKGSKWLDLWMRCGHSRLDAGLGRNALPGWQEDFIMMFEVYYMDNPQKRVLSQIGTPYIEDISGGNGVWFIRTGKNYGDWGHCRWWADNPLSATDTAADETMQAIIGQRVYVEVTLIDRKTNRMASWFRAKAEFEDDEDISYVNVNGVHAWPNFTYGKEGIMIDRDR